MSNQLFPFQDRPDVPTGGGGLIDLSQVSGPVRSALEGMAQRLQSLEQSAQVSSGWQDLIPRRFGADSTVGVKSASFTPESEIQWFRANATSGAITVTVPLAASNPYRRIGVIKSDTSVNAVTLTRSGSDTLNDATSIVLTGRYQVAILKSDGISVWDQENISPGYTLIDAESSSAVASYDFTTGIDSTYNAYMFSLVNVLPVNDDQGFWLRVSEDAGANWKSGASDYDWAAVGRSGGTNLTSNDTADSEIEAIDSGFGANLAVGNATTEGLNGEIYMYNPASTSVHKRFKAHLSWSNASGNAGIIQTTGIYKSANAINGVQFLFETGNIAGGSIRLYGLKR